MVENRTLKSLITYYSLHIDFCLLLMTSSNQNIWPGMCPWTPRGPGGVHENLLLRKHWMDMQFLGRQIWICNFWEDISQISASEIVWMDMQFLRRQICQTLHIRPLPELCQVFRSTVVLSRGGIFAQEPFVSVYLEQVCLPKMTTRTMGAL